MYYSFGNYVVCLGLNLVTRSNDLPEYKNETDRFIILKSLKMLLQLLS